jgi:hypothetical protein
MQLYNIIYKLFLQNFICIIWISTKPCVTPAEGMTAYRHKYAYNYTYTFNCDFLIIGKFGSLLYHCIDIMFNCVPRGYKYTWLYSMCITFGVT